MKIPNILETKRLVIRPFMVEDFNSFISFMCNNEATKYLILSSEQKTPEGAELFIKNIFNSYNSQNPAFALAITQKESGVYLGSCGLSPTENKDEVECYFTLLPQYWGNGYAIESLMKLFEYSFSELKLSKIKAYVNPRNKRSWKTAERSGMKYMGHVNLKNLNSKSMYFLIEKEEFQNKRIL